MILITGGTGSLGQALIPAILAQGVRVAILSRDEYKQAKLQARYPAVKCYIGDVRDEARVWDVFNNELEIRTVIHAAALKRVDSSTNPEELVKTNILGTMHILRAATDTAVDRVLLISSDKACEALNAYGMSKAMAEKVVLAANGYTKCSVLRYGNVLWSRGSVLEHWNETGRVAFTDRGMTRFWLSLPQAVQYIHEALESMQGGEIFVPYPGTATVQDLALVAARDGWIPQGEWAEDTGLRPGGEKRHEVLVSAEEIRCAHWATDRLIRITQTPRKPGDDWGVNEGPWRSDDPWRRLDLDALRQLIAEGRP